MATKMHKKRTKKGSYLWGHKSITTYTLCPYSGFRCTLNAVFCHSLRGREWQKMIVFGQVLEVELKDADMKTCSVRNCGGFYLLSL